MRELYVEIVEEEHAMERFYEDNDEDVEGQQNREAQIIGGV